MQYSQLWGGCHTTCSENNAFDPPAQECLSGQECASSERHRWSIASVAFLSWTDPEHRLPMASLDNFKKGQRRIGLQSVVRHRLSF